MEFDFKFTEFVENIFKDSMDKAGKPYSCHCRIVAELASQMAKQFEFSDEEINWVWQIGILHDVIEDTDYTLEKLSKELNLSPEVITGINIMTHKKNEEYNLYCSKIAKNKYASIVKMADMIHNMQIDRFTSEEQLNRKDKCLKYGKRLYNLVNMF